jgi:ankyrin repeat protein
LLERGADINRVQMGRGKTCLCAACGTSSVSYDLVKLLLDKGADLSVMVTLARHLNQVAGDPAPTLTGFYPKRPSRPGGVSRGGCCRTQTRSVTAKRNFE